MADRIGLFGASGAPIGSCRPSGFAEGETALARRMRSAGASWDAIARALGRPRPTVQAYYAPLFDPPVRSEPKYAPPTARPVATLQTEILEAGKAGRREPTPSLTQVEAATPGKPEGVERPPTAGGRQRRKVASSSAQATAHDEPRVQEPAVPAWRQALTRLVATPATTAQLAGVLGWTVPATGLVCAALDGRGLAWRRADRAWEATDQGRARLRADP